MTDSSASPDRLAQISVEGGSPTPEEAAAAIAVVEGMLREGGHVEESAARDDWERAIREPRKTVHRGQDTWSNDPR